jgi:hypothetical protein
VPATCSADVHRAERFSAGSRIAATLPLSHDQRVTDLAHLLERIEAACTAASATPRSRTGPSGPEELLTEGYLAALMLEGRSRRLAERLEALAKTIDDEESAMAARMLLLDKRTVDQRLSLVRTELTRLQRLMASRGAPPPQSPLPS